MSSISKPRWRVWAPRTSDCEHHPTRRIDSEILGRHADASHRIYRLVRCHWNRQRFGAIKNQYQAQYRTTLRKRVEGETSGKYEKALVAIIEQS